MNGVKNGVESPFDKMLISSPELGFPEEVSYTLPLLCPCKGYFGVTSLRDFFLQFLVFSFRFRGILSDERPFTSTQKKLPSSVFPLSR